MHFVRVPLNKMALLQARPLWQQLPNDPKRYGTIWPGNKEYEDGMEELRFN